MFVINSKKLSYLLLFFSMFVLKIDLAFADSNSNPSSAQSKYWISTGFLSYHPNRKPNYNENNTGIGMEYHIDDKSAFSIGHYKNSERRQSTYLQYVYTPMKIGNTKLGAAIGIVNGYSMLRDSKFAPVLLPVAVTTFKVFNQNIGLNLVYIPSLIPDTDSAFAIQLKFALD